MLEGRHTVNFIGYEKGFDRYGRLTRQTAVNDGVRVLAPFRFNRTSARKHENKLFAVCSYLFVKLYLVLGNFYMLPVKTFGFGNLVKTLPR